LDENKYIDEPEALGPCISNQVSAWDFFEIKKFSVDPDDEDRCVNRLFNPSNHMFFVDPMGNFLSNLKLAFYQEEGPGFFSKMFQEGNESNARDLLTKCY
jgi:hypothetical protein